MKKNRIYAVAGAVIGWLAGLLFPGKPPYYDVKVNIKIERVELTGKSRGEAFDWRTAPPEGKEGAEKP